MKTFEEIKQREIQNAENHKKIWEGAGSDASDRESAIKSAEEVLKNIDAATKIRIVEDMFKFSEKANSNKLKDYINVATLPDGTLNGSETGLSVNDPEFEVLQKYEGVSMSPIATEELLGLVSERYGLDFDQLLEINEKIKTGQISFDKNGCIISAELEQYNQPVLEQGKAR